MNERKLQHGSGINTADEATLEGSVGPNIFESLDDGLVRKAVTRSLAPRSAALPAWVDTGRVRDIFLVGFVRPPLLEHHLKAPSTSREVRQASFFLRRRGGADAVALWR